MVYIVSCLLLLIGSAALLSVAFRWPGHRRAGWGLGVAAAVLAAGGIAAGIGYILRPAAPPEVATTQGKGGEAPKSPAPSHPTRRGLDTIPAIPAASTVNVVTAPNMSIGEVLFPSYSKITLQGLHTLRRELDRARVVASQEREKSKDLGRQLDALEAQIKALTREIKRQNQQTRELHKRLNADGTDG